MSKKGGYVIVDLKGQSITAGTPFTLDGVTARLDRAKTKACLLSGFAIGNDEKRDVFVDLQKTENGYVALFGQYTMTINDDEVTITDGGVLLANIVDDYGRKRFIEGDLTYNDVQGVTFSYGKYSLSGTHLLLVLCGTLEQGATIPATSVTFATATLPQWIADKIMPVWADTHIVLKNIAIFADDWGRSSMDFLLSKAGNNLRFVKPATSSALQPDKNYHFRVEFDLLIDTATE